jgi:Ser/Thr protein kinase RdoA (MazF antagonist)
MKPYDELTHRGKLRRLRQLAINALADYPLSVARLRFLVVHSNTMFRVDSQDGRRYVLRIYSDEDSTLDENEAEMFWLAALKRDTGLHVSEPVPRHDGEYITIASAPGVPAEKRCALFRWVPGRTLDNHLSVNNHYKLGRLMAQLHNHAETLNPLPPTIKPKVWDKVFYYPGEPVVYRAAGYRHLFPDHRIALLDRVIDRAAAVFGHLFADSHGRMLLHGDLHYWNVHLYRDELYAIDFEDIIVGYPVQDIAVTLYYGRSWPDYPDWRAAFRRGYSSQRAWPQEDETVIQTLMAARMVMFVNYVARIDPSPQEFIEAKCEDLQRFLQDYGRAAGSWHGG